jgi:hypothetical protein
MKPPSKQNFSLDDGTGSLQLHNLDETNYPASQGGISWPQASNPQSPNALWLLHQTAAVLGPSLSKCNALTLKLNQAWRANSEPPDRFRAKHRSQFLEFAREVQGLGGQAFRNALGPGADVNIGIAYWPLVPLGQEERIVQVRINYRNTNQLFLGEFTFRQDREPDRDAPTGSHTSHGVIINYSVAIWGPIEDEITIQQLISSSSSYYSARSSP